MPGQLDHSAAKIIRQLLVNNGLVVDPSYTAATGKSSLANTAWPAFYNDLPDTPDRAVRVLDTQGALTNRNQINGEMGGMQGVQVMVRGTAHDTAFAKAEAIAKHLDTVALQEVTLGSTTYVVYGVQRSGDVLAMGVEPAGVSKRYLFSINALVRVRQQ